MSFMQVLHKIIQPGLYQHNDFLFRDGSADSDFSDKGLWGGTWKPKRSVEAGGQVSCHHRIISYKEGEEARRIPGGCQKSIGNGQ